MEITGEVIKIGDYVEITPEFTTRQIVIRYKESNSDYPQEIPLELYNAKCELADKLKVGESIRVSYDLRARQSTKGDKARYVKLVAWALTTVD
jgi:hypothetical protein